MNPYQEAIARIIELEDKNAELLEVLEELQKGIYDFVELPVYAKNFVYRITNEAIRKHRGEDNISDLVAGLERAADLFDDIQDRKGE